MARIALIILSLAILGGCTKVVSAKPDLKEEEHSFKISSQQVQSSVDATGVVQAELEGGAKILSPLAGAVEEIFVRVGDGVKKGTILAAMRSSDATDVYANYLAASSQLKQAERTYELNKQLFEVGAITKNDLLNSEAAFEQIRSNCEGLKKKLEI